MKHRKYMMESFRKLGGRTYQCLNIYDLKSRAVKAASEFREWGYAARVIKLPQGWAVYRTPKKVR